jgi:hypothetical protein
MAPTRWALLCGVNFYMKGTARDTAHKNRSYPPLYGCVKDVQDIHKLLVALGTKLENITTLTATANAQGDGAVEEPDRLPTRKNFKRELDRIAAKAKKGDLVYIHYSGHGIRRDRVQRGQLYYEDEERGEEDGSLDGTALVMTDVLQGKPYLSGYHLGVWIRNMVNEGLRVTLVLDSCYSGGGLRAGTEDDDDLTLRTVPNEIDMSELDCDIEADLEVDDINYNMQENGTRNPNPNRGCWLSNPSGCTVITACTHSQAAGEKFYGDAKRGVLTCWILKKLRVGGEPAQRNALPSHARLVDRIKVHLRGDGQTPTVHGDGHIEFFGTTSYVEKRVCHVISRLDRTIHLDVGRAQGVVSGAQYDVFDDDVDVQLPNSSSSSIRATVTTVSESSCAATLSGDLPPVGTWVAALRYWALPQPVYVDFEPEDGNVRRQLEEELNTTPNLHLCDSTIEATDCELSVRVDTTQHYEILQDGRRLPLLPRISVNSSSAIRRLGYVLSHVARFQALQRLYQAQASQKLPRRDFEFGATPTELEHDQTTTISLTYKGTYFPSLWTSIYCFSASWEILQLDPDANSGDVALMALPDNPILHTTSMCFEEKDKTHPDDPDEVTDLFVVFVSSGQMSQMSWMDICLPSLQEFSDKSFDVWAHEAGISLEEDKRMPKKGNRSVKKEKVVDWTVFQQPVRTRKLGSLDC